jgi:exopolysaccharide biosynthesis polyprenyl glycosylphosphotransferase
MERRAENLSRNVYFYLDVVLTGVSFYLAFLIKQNLPWGYSGLAGSNYYPVVLLLVLLCASVSYNMSQLYQPGQYLDLANSFICILKAVLTALIILVLLLFLWHMADISRLFLALFAGLTVALLFAVRVGRMLLHHNGIVQGSYQREILIIGSRDRAKDLIQYLQSVSYYSCRILGCLEVDESSIGREVVAGVKVIGSMKDFRQILLELAVDEVIFAMPLKHIDNAAALIADTEHLGINMRILPDWQIHQMRYRPEIAAVHVEDFVGLPTLSLTSTSRRVCELTLKELIDRCSAFLGLILLSPLFVLISLTIRLTSEGPVFFRQKRSGLNGRTFSLYKFRSMVLNAEELRAGLEDLNQEDGPAFKLDKDPRVTWIGRLLRKTSLDELPQLINVFKGEMSLVGPRPPIPAEVEQYDLWQRRRLSMKPGITCIWQVSGRNSVAFDQWMRMDLDYIDNWSLWLDIKLLLRTIPAVVLGTGR